MKTCHRLCVAVLARTAIGLLALAPLANLAHAASTTISDVPLAAAKRPNPNMIMAIDDSGSMDFELAANVAEGVFWWNQAQGRFHGRIHNDCSDYVSKGTWGGTGSLNFNGAGGYGTQASKCPSEQSPLVQHTWIMYAYLFPNGSCGQTSPTIAAWPCDARTYNDGGIVPAAPTQQLAFLHSSDYNRMYYNPGVTYLPWKPYSDGTTSCPSGTMSSGVCTPGNASTTSTLTHPVYGSASSISNLPLFSLYTGLDGSSNPQTGFIFRLHPGMILPRVPTGAGLAGTTKYRLCVEGTGCGGWLTPGTSNACLVNTSITSCANNMGMLVGSGAAGKIDMAVTPSGYTVNAPYNYVEAAITYTPGTYWKVDTTNCGTMASPNTTNLINGTCAYGPDGRLIYKVDLKTAAGPFTVPAGRTDCGGGTSCTLTEERQNFANWFQYYRKRSHMMNAALGNAFDGLRGLRAGYFVFSNAGNSPQAPLTNLSMYDFDSGSSSTNATRAIGALYRVTGNATAGTKTRPAMDYLGQQFRRTDAAAPITNYCQFNAGFVITDGFANGITAATSYGNYDNQAGSAYPYNMTYGTNSTAPFADSVSNSLADIAMKLYTENPRPLLTPVGKVPVDKSDVSPGADRNPNLHVNIYGMTLNLTGRIYGNIAAFPNQNNDPYTYAPSWNSLPDVTATSGSPVAIDELWHATINARGQMLLASNPEEARDAVLTVVANVVAKGGAAAAVAVSNPNPVAGDNFAYASSYNSGSWSGDINSYTIDVTTGQPSTTPNWIPSPQRLLANRDLTTNPRIIATYSGTAGTPFQWSSLTSAQQSALNNDSQVLSFLRGSRGLEGIKFRGRGPRPPFTADVVPDNIAVLGDIVNAEPLYVSAPRFAYVDNGYAAFKTGAAANRTKVVYQGANDGMLHAFNAANGSELWAYVPNAMFPTLLNLSSKNAFTHKFYIDGTPVSADVDFSASSTTADWRTILVGAYGKGGRGFYALDVTDPVVTSETALASKVLWEFPNASTSDTDNANMGNSFGRAIVVKTRAAGWVVLAASGYNNNTTVGSSSGDGKGHLFVLNPTNGSKIADLTTGNGSNATPSGLAYVSAWVDHANTDNTVEAVYGGDLTGAVWRFDLSGTTTASWKVQLVAKLVDSSNNAQPITTEPELGVVSGFRMIYVGTGQYLGSTDIPGATGANASATSTQTMYALKEPKPYAPTGAPLTTALITPLRSTLVQQTLTKSFTTSAGTTTAGSATLTSNAVNLASKTGWYIDLPQTGERVVTNPSLAQGVLSFTSNIPDGADPCLPGGSSWSYDVHYATGGYIPNSSTTSGVAGKWLGNVLASRPQVIQLQNGESYELIRKSDMGMESKKLPPAPSSTSGKRKSWREMNMQ